MKYLKQFEGFEYQGQEYAKQICEGWGVDLEDIEDLFLDFADEGKVLIHPMLLNKELKVTIHSIWEGMEKSDWFSNPLWDERFDTIEKRLNRMGLDMFIENRGSIQRLMSVRIAKIN